MNTAGYPGTPLAKKLGMKEGQKVAIINAPIHYYNLFADLPDLNVIGDNGTKKDLVHYFVKEEMQLVKDLLSLKNSIEQNGMIWISWPKKSSGVITDITEDTVRKLALS